MKSKRIIAIILSVLISLTMILNNVVVANALVAEILAALAVAVDCTIATENSQSYNDWYENTYKVKWREAMSELANNRGFIPQILNDAPWLGPDPIQSIKDWMEIHSGTPSSNITDAEAKEQLYNMWSNNVVNSGDDTFMIGGDLNNYLQYCINNYIDESGFFYIYTTKLNNYTASFNSGEQYNALRRFLVANPGKIVCINTLNDLNDLQNIYVFDYDSNYGVIGENSYPNDNLLYSCHFYNFNDWNEYYPVVYNWDSSSENYVSSNNVTNGTGIHFRLNQNTPTPGRGLIGAVDINVRQLMAFHNLASLKRYSAGEAPYYINESVYNDWSTSSGDYTIGSNNSNFVKYGDIITYNNNYYGGNGTWPTPDEIQRFIQDPSGSSGGGSGGSGGQGGSGGSGGSATSSATANNEGINITINNNHNLNIGGSSLSGNTVSGNGTDGSGSISNIFDWLGNLGNIIGNFVRNVGEMIVNALEGIGEAITTILEGIPNILSPLIEFVFGGLPEELQALITLGITCAIFVGVIKAIKK